MPIVHKKEIRIQKKFKNFVSFQKGYNKGLHQTRMKTSIKLLYIGFPHNRPDM